MWMQAIREAISLGQALLSAGEAGCEAVSIYCEGKGRDEKRIEEKMRLTAGRDNFSSHLISSHPEFEFCCAALVFASTANFEGLAPIRGWRCRSFSSAFVDHSSAFCFL